MNIKGVQTLKLANCAKCPLRAALVRLGDWKPVPSELNDTDTVFILDSPEKRDTDVGFPAVGPMGAVLLDALKGAGRARKDVSYVHLCACRYPNDRKKEFMGRLQAANRRAARAKEPTAPTPEECCRPRLEAELAMYKNIVAFGSDALKAVGVDRTLNTPDPTLADFRGFPTVDRQGRKLLATELNVMREPKWRPVMHQDVQKAFRHFAGQLDWSPPRKVFKPTVQQLALFYAAALKTKGFIVFDVETAPHAYRDDGDPVYDADKDPLRCLGLLGGDTALVLPFMPVDSEKGYIKRDGSKLFDGYTTEELQAIYPLVAQILGDARIQKVGHNARVYDRMVCERHFGVEPTPVLDTHPMHKLGDSEYPHRLGFLASVLTDSPPWKAEHTASEARSDLELYEYNANDLKNNKLVTPGVVARAKSRGQFKLYDTYAQLQDVCVGMHRLGMKLDKVRLAEHEERLNTRASHELIEARRICEDVDFNPRSSQQMGRLLFDRWSLPVQDYTDAGEPSSDDAVLRKLLGSPLVESWQKDFIKHVRRYKSSVTLLSNFVLKWKFGGPYVDRDGWIHPDFNAAGTVGWRFSSSNPNFQNIPGEYLIDFGPDGLPLGYDKAGKLTGSHKLPSGVAEGRWNLRDIIVAPEGLEFVAADMDQLELRLAAALADATYYLEAFEKNEIDPHNLSGQMIFGPAYWDQDGAPKDPRKKGEGAFKRRRDLIKRFVYAALYGAEPKTIHEVLTEAEDSAGELTYADLRVPEVRRIHARWLKAAPEFANWWQRTVGMYRADGYLADPVWGLRRYFANGEEFNELINYRVQAGGGAIVHRGMLPLVHGPKAALPFDFAAKTGLCLQVHDSLMFMVRTQDAQEAMETVEASLKQRIDGLDVTFTAEAKRGFRWART